MKPTPWIISTIVLAMLIIMHLFGVFNKDSKSQLEELEMRLSNERSLREMETNASNRKIDSLFKINRKLIENDSIRSTTKTKNNETLASDIDIIRNSPLDTLILSRHDRPEGY